MPHFIELADVPQPQQEPGYNVVAPSPSDYLTELFGTTEPEVPEVEKVIADQNIYWFGRWAGMYVIG